MTALEITFVLFLNIFTVLVICSLAYVTVVLPLRDEMAQLREKQRQDHWERVKVRPELLSARPPGVLPSIDDIPESVWNNVGDYGDDHSTPDDVEQEMSELQVATREADLAWQDLETMKHGKRQPLIYTGS